MNDEYYNYLMHHGILGMKWGKRKAVYKSSTAAANKEQDELKNKKPVSKEKSIKTMSDDELRNHINRIELENRYSSLNPKQISKGKKLSKRILNNMIIPAAEDAGRQLIKSMITKSINKNFKLHDEFKVYTNNKRK